MTTSTICLKGMRDRLGPSLELAPHVTYLGRPMYQGGWRLARSPWANPYTVQRVGGAGKAVEMYLQWLRGQPALIERAIAQLTGRTLACWCERPPCHAAAVADALDSGEAARWLAGHGREPRSEPGCTCGQCRLVAGVAS